jgi:hypothetical protein
MSNIFFRIGALPGVIRNMIVENLAALIRTTGPTVIDEVMKEELVQSLEIFPYCAKCGENARILSRLSFCHGCVEYGYTLDIYGKPVPPYAKLAAGGVVRENNLFGRDDESLMLMI